MRAVILLKTSVGGLWSVPLASGLRQVGFEVLFALPSEEGSLPDLVRSYGMEVVQAEAPIQTYRPLAQMGAITRLRRQLMTVEPSVVVSHLYGSAIAGRLALLNSDIPHVFMSAGPLYLENRAIRFAERLGARLDAHIICSSGALYSIYRRLGVPRHRLSLIPYAWSSRRGSTHSFEERQQARQTLAIEPDAIVAVCVAMFYAPKNLVFRGQGIKGHHVLLAAWEAYRRSGGLAELFVVGGGFGPSGAEHRSKLMHAYAHVPGVRWVDTATDVRDYYRAANFSISPSLSDNLGAPGEASMLGVPSIASSVGGLPEIVVDGWNGWLVPPGDADALAKCIAYVAGMPAEERAIFGRRARLRAEELLTEEANVQAFTHVVHKVATAAPV